MKTVTPIEIEARKRAIKIFSRHLTHKAGTNLLTMDEAINAIAEGVLSSLPSPVSVSDEEKAIGFINWVPENHFVRRLDGLFVCIGPYKKYPGVYTASELYSLYIKETNKP